MAREVTGQRPIAGERSITGARPTSSSRSVAPPLPEPPSIAANTEGQSPFAYQIAAARWMRGRRRCVLADEMGLGKTAITLRAIPAAPTVVVCPASVRGTWRAEAAKWRPELRAVLPRAGDFRVPMRGELVAVSFESLPLEPTALGGLGDATLVVDEAHRVKNEEALRSLKVQRLGRLCARVYLLTGTPLLNSPPELWGVLAAAGLARKVFGSWATFCELFGGTLYRGGVRWAELPPHPEEIRKRLARVMLRRLRRDVLPNLPGKRYRDVPVEVSDALAAELDRVDREWRARGDDELPPLELVGQLRAMLASDRIGAMLEHVEDFEAQHETPLVVFSAHREPVDALASRPGWAVITGDASSSARQRAVDAFQAGELRGIAATIQAGGLGLTLTRAAHVLFVDLSWTPADNAQAEDRCARIGQAADHVLVTRLHADHALERRVYRILDRKRAMIDATFGGAIGGAT
ncbi:MAG TPA: DEAD/DEAH box helicase [Chloroflexota bacterium]|nr:DEAD/DEAH box helicase [Chloroflexota bacterium]